MSVIALRDIQRIAEQESARHNHYYIGVEHLFIAMSKLKHGITNAVLEVAGIEPRFIRYSIRHEIGVNEEGRYWPGFRETPRVQSIYATCKKYAGIHSPTEQHLLLAILDENDNLPTRILVENGVDIKELRQIASNWSPKQRSEMPQVPIELLDANLSLGDDERIVIQRMFRTHSKIVIERELNGSYTGSRLLVIQPYQSTHTEARVVVKIAERAVILHEQHHYETYVKDTFPPTTARLLDNPSLPESCPLGGLKYSLVKPTDSTDPMDLRALALQISPIELGNLLRESVYKVYAEPLWWQRQRYRFGVWREYEHVLPAALEIEYLESADVSGIVIEPLGVWSRDGKIGSGQIVVLRNFVVQKVRYREGSMQVAAGGGAEAVNRSSKVEIIGLGKNIRQFRRGEVIDKLIGRVHRRREDILFDQVMLLEPDFDVNVPKLTNIPYLDEVPNPLFHVSEFLERHVRGYMSIIHGDLHLGNILVGPAGDAWLIDFALVREGHSLFDWAVLEISILTITIAQHFEEDWDSVWYTAYLLKQINNFQYHANWENTPLAESIRTISQLREIVQENLTQSDKWHEYYIALMMVALRGLSWDSSASKGVRRLLFAVAALSIQTAIRAEKGQLTTQGGTAEMPTDAHRRMPPDISSSNDPFQDDF